MASNNSSVVQSFSIALIVFVMLTFVLAVTTYLFFKKFDEAQKALEVKQKEASDANTKRLDAERDRVVLVKDVLGFPEDMANAEILERKQDAIDDIYGKYLDEPTYEAAVDWLSSSIDRHYASLKSIQDEKDRFAAEKKQLEVKQAAELKKLDDSRKDAQGKYDALLKEKSEYEKTATTDKNKLVEDATAANAKAKRLQALSEQIVKDLQPYVSPEKRKDFDGAADDERRVTIIRDEMRAREKDIAKLNRVIAQLRVADPALQATVLAATPKDNRVDDFDGRILSVNELDRTVLVACGRTTGLRAGLQFYVYDPTDPQPQLDSKKGVVEVVAIESDSLVRCRVRKDAVSDPILPGDVVATSLWSPGTPLEVVVVGIVQFGGDPAGDATRLRQLVERIGGTVEEDVVPTTTLVVDAGIPQAKGIEAEGGSAGRKQITAKQKANRSEQLEKAKQLGIKIMAIEPFLDMMGLQLDAVRANRLPVPVNDQAAPARSDALAF